MEHPIVERALATADCLKEILSGVSPQELESVLQELHNNRSSASIFSLRLL